MPLSTAEKDTTETTKNLTQQERLDQVNAHADKVKKQLKNQHKLVMDGIKVANGDGSYLNKILQSGSTREDLKQLGLQEKMKELFGERLTSEGGTGLTEQEIGEKMKELFGEGLISKGKPAFPGRA